MILRHLTDWGIARERIHGLPRLPSRTDYLASLTTLDFIIDTSPYGGHSTVGEALCLGIPVLTHLGSTTTGRVGASMMHHLGLGDLVPQSLDERLATLATLAKNADTRAAWTARFQTASTRTKATNLALVRALEQAYAEPFQAPLATTDGG